MIGGRPHRLYLFAALVIASSSPFGGYAYPDKVRSTTATLEIPKGLLVPGSLVNTNPTPNYDKEVLQPLHDAQRKEAEELAQAEIAKEAAYQADLDATTARVHPLGTYDASSYAAYQCVWYIATRIKLYRFLGNANEWPYTLPQYGFRQGAPRQGAIAISEAGAYGHAALVEAVEGDRVFVSEYNALVPYGYDERWVGSEQFLYFF